MSSQQHFDLHVLILEDDPKMMRAMVQGFDRPEIRARLVKKKLRLTTTQISHTGALLGELQGTLFHFASLDLRVPDQPGGSVGSEQNSLKQFVLYRKWAPLTHVAVMTQYGSNYLGALQQSGQYNYEFWQKALVPGESDLHSTPPILTLESEWAERVIGQLDDFGRAQAFAWSKAKHLLPGALRASAAALEKCCENPWAESPVTLVDAKNHRVRSREGLLHAFELAEQLQNWIWTVLCAYLAAIAPSTLPLSVARVLRGGTADERPVEQRRFDKEQQLGELCSQTLAYSRMTGALLPLLLVQLGCSEKEPAATRFVTALRLLRERRNKLEHESKNLDHASVWGEIALPLRWLLNAAAYLTTYPIVTEVEPLGKGSVRARRLGTDRSTSGGEEWYVPHGILRSPDNSDSPETLEYEKPYALWPVAPGKLSLLPLWPLVETRSHPNHTGREAFLYLMRDAHKRARDLNTDTLVWSTNTDARERDDAIDQLAAFVTQR